VSSRPARTGLWFALTLALPSTFAGAWLWLVPGGVITRMAASERRLAEQALAGARQRLDDEFAAAADLQPVPLQLDDRRRVRGPFPAPDLVGEDGPTASIAEQNGIARAQAGDHRGALPWFAHARQRGELTPFGWLHYGNALAMDEPDAAVSLLAEARQHCQELRCGPLPFAALAWLAEARWTRASQQPVAAPSPERLQQLAAQVPAASIPDLVSAFVTDAGEPSLTAVLLPLCEVAATAVAMTGGEVAAPLEPGPGPLPDTVLWPRGADALAVLPSSLVVPLRDQALLAATTAAPGWRFLATATVQPDAPNLLVPSLGTYWLAQPTTMPASVWLTGTARSCLGLAVLTLVLGNLLLWRMNRREAQLVKLRSDFVDVVSHELRTPLAAISLKAELLARGDVPDGRREHYLHGLHHDVQRLADQVERILDFGRLQHGAPLRHARIEPRVLLARALRAVRPALRLVQQQLSVQAPRTLPPLLGDLEVLSRALRNLLENAAKYAPRGSTVAMRAFAVGNQLIVEVADQGPGIPAVERERIFQPFVRGAGADAGTAGSGLGLALVAAAAHRHGGSITVRDGVAGGSVFVLSLPLPHERAS
jgi:signal transduction histidine kinase